MPIHDSAVHTVHVAPTRDLVQHQKHDCICGPTIEPVKRADGSVWWLATHHSLDGREAEEIDGTSGRG